MAEQQTYGIQEVAEILGVARVTVQRMAKAGKLPYISIGAGPKPRMRFSRQRIDELVNGNAASDVNGARTEGSPRPEAAEKRPGNEEN